MISLNVSCNDIIEYKLYPNTDFFQFISFLFLFQLLLDLFFCIYYAFIYFIDLMHLKLNLCYVNTI